MSRRTSGKSKLDVSALACDDRMVPIPGFKSVKQATENAGAMEFGLLTESHVKEIRAIAGKYGLKD